MPRYRRTVIEKYALNCYCRVRFNAGKELVGWLVRDFNDERRYALLQANGEYTSFPIICIRRIVLFSNNYELPYMEELNEKVSRKGQ